MEVGAYVVNSRTGERWEFPSVKEAEAFIANDLERIDPEGVFEGYYQIDDMSVEG